jgi:hypothetical protein
MTFAADLEAALNDASAARAELVSAVQPLAEPDLDRARRGGWPVHRVIEHAIQHDYYMAMFIARARGKQAAMGDPTCAGQPIDEIVCRMEDGRRALLALIDGIDEDAFYELQKLGHDEFSPLTALENAAAHDREHAAQIASILAA